MSEVVAVVPARGGSKGIPRKNLREVDGRPLVAHQIETALAADTVDQTICSTDDDEIAAMAREYGADVPFRRPPEYATDEVPVIAAMRHCAEFLLENSGDRPSQLLCLQPTSPFTTPGQVDEAVEKLRETGCDSVATVARVTDTHPYRAYRLEDDRIQPLEGVTVETPDQRQDRPEVYGFTGAVYARRPSLLLEWEGADFALGADVRAIVQTGESTVEIDTKFDLRVARALAATDPDSSDT